MSVDELMKKGVPFTFDFMPSGHFQIHHGMIFSSARTIEETVSSFWEMMERSYYVGC